MKAKCVKCSKTPNADSWKDFDYISGDFYCQDCSPYSENWCRLCERTDIPTEKHHLIPQSEGGNKTEIICVSCHRKIHATFTNKELAHHLNTVEVLRRHKKMKNYLRWIKKTNKKRVSFKESDRKKRIKSSGNYEAVKLELEPPNFQY